MPNKTRILFFIGNLASGGKERRMIELLTYLNNTKNYELMVVLTKKIIHYPQFFTLNIPVKCIEKKREKNDLTLFPRFYQICRKFKPDLIHTWGRKQTFYALPTIIFQKIPLINGQITSAPPPSYEQRIGVLLDYFNFRFSKIILSNSQAGIEAYNPPSKKSTVIYNGINLTRFENLPDIEQIKEKYHVYTPYAVVMAASYSCNKDYNLFYEIAKIVVNQRDDITFIGVGGYDFKNSSYDSLVKLSSENTNIIFMDRIQDVEALIKACDIGVLFSNTKNHGEGISNSILEYMALAKPVIANDAGGTREVVCHNTNGYLITTQTVEKISDLIIELINNSEKRISFGKESRKLIEDKFSLNKMGEAFVQVYEEALQK